MRFDVTILGSNSAIPANGRHPSAQVLTIQNRPYLIDCGEGTQIRLTENSISRNRIQQIFISHLHGDHVFGLIGLLTTMSLVGRKNALDIFAPAGLQEMIEVQLHHTQGHLDFSIAFHVIDTEIHQVIFEDELVQVFSLPLDHRVPCSGFLFVERPRPRNIRPAAIREFAIPVHQINGLKAGSNFELPDGRIIPNNELTWPPYQSRSYAYCSDTAYREALIPLIKGVDLLYHESTFLHEKLEQAIATRHSTALQAAQIAVQAEVGELILGHYSSRYKDLQVLLAEAQSVFPVSQLGLEGKTYEVVLKREEV